MQNIHDDIFQKNPIYLKNAYFIFHFLNHRKK